jgi:hypothetical protein
MVKRRLTYYLSKRGANGLCAFDTLGFAKRLRDNGVPQAQAEAHAEAARDFIMAQLVTQQDLQAAVALLDNKLDTLSLRLTVRL